MTISLTPGCYGSALFYSVRAPECDGCAHALQCAEQARERQESTLQRVRKLDARFSTETAPKVSRWMETRWKRDTASDAKHSAAQQNLDTFKRAGLNVYEVTRRLNPVKNAGPLKTCFSLIIDNGAGFTRNDIRTELYAAHPNVVTKLYAKKLTDQICDALLCAGVLKAEKRGILCLNN